MRLAREQQATPRSRGLREALRQVVTTRQAVLVSRTKAINELKSLIVVAPEHLRAQLRGRPLVKQLDRIEQLASPPGAAVEHRVTVLTLRSIAGRIRRKGLPLRPGGGSRSVAVAPGRHLGSRAAT